MKESRKGRERQGERERDNKNRKFSPLIHPPHLHPAVGLLAVTELHHVRLPGQRDQWWQALAGVCQTAVDIELHVDVAALEPAHSQDDRVGASVRQVSVLQVDSVDLPISPHVPHQHWGRSQGEVKTHEWFR